MRGRIFLSHLHRIMLFHALRMLKTCNFHNCFRGGARFVRDVPFTVRGLHRLLRRNFPRCPCLYRMLRHVARLGRFTTMHGHHGLAIAIVDFSCQGKVPRSRDKGNKKCIFSYHTMRGPKHCRRCGSLAKLSTPIVRFLRGSKRVARFLHRASTLISTRIRHFLRHKFSRLVVYFKYAKKRRHSICSTRRATVRLRRGFGVGMRLVRQRRRVSRLLGTG